jgi:hypothetical protein
MNSIASIFPEFLIGIEMIPHLGVLGLAAVYAVANFHLQEKPAASLDDAIATCVATMLEKKYPDCTRQQLQGWILQWLNLDDSAEKPNDLDSVVSMEIVLKQDDTCPKKVNIAITLYLHGRDTVDTVTRLESHAGHVLFETIQPEQLRHCLADNGTERIVFV